jgi:hypothetical protein
MKTAARTLVLCITLVSSLSQASPEPLAEAPHGNYMMEAAMGGLGSLLVIPGALAGYLVGGALIGPTRSCDHAGCDVLLGPGAVLGFFLGGATGLCGGTGLGVALAGQANGGQFNLGHAIGGSVLGSLLGLAVTVPVLSTMSYLQIAIPPWLNYVVPVAVLAGGVAGSVFLYEASRPFLPPGARIAPAVSLVPGGGTVGVTGNF